MKKHPVFDLWLHDDEELETIAGAGLCDRVKLREWPLSLVERIRFQDGRSRIYKAQRGFPTEPTFYRKAHGKHIPAVYFNDSRGDNHWLVLEDIDGGHPAPSDRGGLLDLGLEIREITAALGNPELCRHDLSAKGFGPFVHATVERLKALRRADKLQTTGDDAILRIGEAFHHPEVAKTVGGRCILLHGDLKADNILVRANGEIALIDWQNVLFGPAYLDIYSLMATAAIDPVPIGGIGPEILRMGLELRWFADCLYTWMPNAAFLDGWIANIENHMRHVIKNDGYNGRAVYCFH